MDDDINSKLQYIQRKINEQKKINGKQDEINNKQNIEIESISTF